MPDGVRHFDGRAVVVTGGGRGMGRACAELLASQGARVVVNDIGLSSDGTTIEDAGVAEEVVGAIGAVGGTAVASVHDLRSRAACVELVAEVESRWGQLDAVIHCASTFAAQPADEMSVDATTRLLDGALLPGVNITYAAFVAMLRRGSGRIVLCSSGAGLFGASLRSAYAAGKAGLIGLVRSLALECAGTDVRINAVLPAAQTRMAPNSGSPPPAVTAVGIVALADERFDGNGELYSIIGRQVCRVGIAITRPVAVDSIDAALEAFTRARATDVSYEGRSLEEASAVRAAAVPWPFAEPSGPPGRGTLPERPGR
jgi:NAD(P)-dependent dehydrogenase (short-subunit alcohol dehydrogenase family)